MQARSVPGSVLSGARSPCLLTVLSLSYTSFPYYSGSHGSRGRYGATRDESGKFTQGARARGGRSKGTRSSGASGGGGGGIFKMAAVEVLRQEKRLLSTGQLAVVCKSLGAGHLGEDRTRVVRVGMLRCGLIMCYEMLQVETSS